MQRVLVLAVLLIAPQIARAQDRPAPSVDLAAGWVGFADDGIVSETMVGAALRWYVSSRFAIGPEAIYIAGGVRVAAGDRVTIGVDARIGWETHVRVNAVAGIRLF